MALRRGVRIEVRSEEPGFVGSWYEATLLKKSVKSCWLRYATLVGENSDQPLEECVPVGLVRPVPPPIPTDRFEEGDAVEVYDREGWWVGTVTKALDGERYLVYFRESGEEIDYPASTLRLRQDWHSGLWIQVFERKNPNLESYRKRPIQSRYQERGYSADSKKRVLMRNQQQRQHPQSNIDNDQRHNDEQEELHDIVPNDHSPDHENSDTAIVPLTSARDLSSPSTEAQRRTTTTTPSKRKESSARDDDDHEDEGHRRKRMEDEAAEAPGNEIEEQEHQQSDGSRDDAPGNPDDYCMLKYIQRKAYSCVLRALRSKNSSLTWQQERLISELRWALDIDNDVHIRQLELLNEWELKCQCKSCCNKT